MSGQKKDVDVLLFLIEQNLGDAKHISEERNWFVNVYLLSTAGFLALLTITEEQIGMTLLPFILLFLLVMSILGSIVITRLAHANNEHWENLWKILQNEQMKQYQEYIWVEDSPKLRWRFLRVTYIYTLMFVIFSLIWGLALISILLN